MQAQWFADEKIDRSQWVKLKKLSHMRYQHEDLNVITTFLRGMCCDFGFVMDLG